MSKNENVHQLTVNVPIEGQGTHVGTIYGCRYPDGHIEWEKWSDYSNVGWSFEALVNIDVKDNSTVRERWHKTLKQRAEAANIPVSEYIEDHVLLKRTVVLATTAPEEV